MSSALLFSWMRSGNKPRPSCHSIRWPPLPQADAIVVLSGGLYYKAPEYGGDTVNNYVLERMRYAVQLYRLTGKPVLVTGGSWRDGARPEADTMKESFE